MSALPILGLLQHYGPSLTSDIAAHLRDQGRSAEAARKAVSRLPPSVRVLRGLTFPKRARFIYLEEQFATGEYWDALTEAVSRANPAYAAALAGLRSRGTIVPSRHFEIISGAPVRQKGQISGSTILERLAAVSLVSRGEMEGIGECTVLGSFGGQVPVGQRRLRARLLTEAVLLDAVRSWAGRMNLASPRATRIRDEMPAPQFATFRFDLCGPCYLRPLVRRMEAKVSPGFLVADVVAGESLDEAGVQPFLRKCQMLSHLRKVRPFLPALIADGFSPAALRACRAQGIITTRPDTLFGRDVSRAFTDLLETLSNAARAAAGSPERIEHLFRQLSAVEGAAGNLRGALFELIVGHLVRSIEGGSIDMGVVVSDHTSNRSAEIDVRLVKERELIFYECKGYQPSSVVKADEVEDWLKRRISTIRKAHLEEARFDGCTMRFEFWTCAKFDDEARSLLVTAKQQTKNYGIDWREGTAIRNYAKRLRYPGIRKILDDHYFDHPLNAIPAATNSGEPPPRRMWEPVAAMDADWDDIDLDAECAPCSTTRY